MADGGDTLSARTVSSISEIDSDVWNGLANPGPSAFDPFVTHEFLAALETSGSVGPETGWAPMHLLLEDCGSVIGAAPLYLKSHSQGEYVFDHHWADAYERAGGRYYPKIVCAVPFTPVPGPRLLGTAAHAKAAAAGGLIAATRQTGVSSLHANFLTPDDEACLTAVDCLTRRGVQYHWFNRGYDSFAEFLATLSSRKRKAIRRERRAADESGLKIRALRGADIGDRHWDAFWAFYQDTGGRKWGRPYLSRSFFSIISETMQDRLLMFVAERNGAPVAGALNFIGANALVGRYWGAIEHHPFLHFELCYYQAIDYAISHRLARVEAGAQGEHKIARGYEPVETRSAHWIADPSFRRAIGAYLEQERLHNETEIDVLTSFTPYRKDTG